MRSIDLTHLLVLALHSINGRLKHVSAVIYRWIININLFQSASTDIKHLQEQRRLTRVYLFVYLVSLGLLLFYSGVIERKIGQTHRLTSIMDYEHLHEQYSDAIQCPCVHISIPYKDFVSELRVQSFHQACLAESVGVIFSRGKAD